MKVFIDTPNLQVIKFRKLLCFNCNVCTDFLNLTSHISPPNKLTTNNIKIIKNETLSNNKDEDKTRNPTLATKVKLN